MTTVLILAGPRALRPAIVRVRLVLFPLREGSRT
jgi:hypothetical protein